MIKLNNFQEISLEEINKTREFGFNKALIVLPSGTGKTLIAVKDSLNYEKILYIAHHTELLEQTQLYFFPQINKKDIGNINELDCNKKVNFITIQKLNNNLNLYSKNSFDYIILDEAHHSPAPSYLKIINHFDFKFLLGLTATPYRLDQKKVLEIFDNNIIKVGNLFDAIKNGFLNPFNYYGFKDNINFEGLKFKGFDYDRSDLDKRLFIDERDKAIVEKYKTFCKDRKILAFCNSINHIKRCVKFFRDSGINCEEITHKTPIKKRKQIIKDFKKNKIKLIFSVNIFNEGIDFPDVDTVLLLRPTASATVFFQQIGRALRKSKGKKKSLILDFVGNHPYAHKSREWISNGHIFNKENKLEYIYPLGCDVNFESEVIDIMNKQLMSKLIKKIEVIAKDYLRIRKENRPLFKEEIFMNGSIRLKRFLYYFSWEDLMFYMDEKIKIKNIKFSLLSPPSNSLGIR